MILSLFLVILWDLVKMEVAVLERVKDVAVRRNQAVVVPSCDMTDMMLGLANQALEELMMKKMKAEWEKLRGKNMEKMAVTSVEASMVYWKHKMEGMYQCEESKQKMQQSFHG